MSGKVSLVAYLKAKPGKDQELLDGLLKLVEPSRSEGGCIDYHLHRSTEDPLIFMFYENWVAMADLDEHLKMPYLEPLLTRSDELLDGEIKIEFYTMLSDPPA